MTAIDVVKLLLQKKSVDVNKATDSGLHPLYIAAMRGDVDIVKALLRRRELDVN